MVYKFLFDQNGFRFGNPATKANTLANKSQPIQREGPSTCRDAVGQLSNRVSGGATTLCETIEAHIAASTILDWVVNGANDREERAFIRETQLSALQQRGKIDGQQAQSDSSGKRGHEEVEREQLVGSKRSGEEMQQGGSTRGISGASQGRTNHHAGSGASQGRRRRAKRAAAKLQADK